VHKFHQLNAVHACVDVTRREIVKKAALEERFESQMRRTQELETAIGTPTQPSPLPASLRLNHTSHTLIEGRLCAALLREDTLRLMERTQGNPALISKRRAEERSRLSSLEAERSRPVAEGAWGALLRYTGFAGDTGHAEAAAPPAPPMPSGPPTPSAPSAPPAPPNGAPAVPQQSAAQPDKQQGTPTGSGNTGDRTV
jgi:hypothetical protein